MYIQTNWYQNEWNTDFPRKFWSNLRLAVLIALVLIKKSVYCIRTRTMHSLQSILLHSFQCSAEGFQLHIQIHFIWRILLSANFWMGIKFSGLEKITSYEFFFIISHQCRIFQHPLPRLESPVFFLESLEKYHQLISRFYRKNWSDVSWLEWGTLNGV